MSSFKLIEKYPYIFIFFLVALISFTTLSSAFLFIDDTIFIVNNPRLEFSINEIVAAFSKPMFQIYEAVDYHVRYLYYRPALTLFYMINKAVWGINPVGFHLSNLFLHLLTTVIVYKTGLLLFAGDKTLSLFSASFFCVHPAHNELLGRVAMNENLLGFFISISLYFYLQKKKHLAIGAFVFALLSKESAVMFPFVLFVFEVRDVGFKKAIAYLKPFLLPLCIYLAVRTAVLGLPSEVFKSHDPFGVAVAVSAVADYFRLLLLPYPLSVFYPVLKFASVFDTKILISISVCFLLVYIAWQVRADKLILPLFLGTFIFLVPVIVKANELVLGVDRAYIAERQLYVPSILFALFLAGVLYRYCKFYQGRNTVSFLFAVVFVFAGFSAATSSVWKNDDLIQTRIIHDFPEVSLSHQLKGESLLKMGELNSALVEFNAVLPFTSSKGKPDTLAYQPLFAEVHYSIGEVYLAKGDKVKAINKFKTALILQPFNCEWRARLAETYLKIGKLKDAQREFKVALAAINGNSIGINK